MASRLLDEAMLFTTQFSLTLSTSGRTMGLAQCEDTTWILLQVSNALRKVSMQCRIKTKFLHVIPYRVSEAEDIEQARECAQQLRQTDPNKRRLFEHVYVEELLPTLDALLVYFLLFIVSTCS